MKISLNRKCSMKCTGVMEVKILNTKDMTRNIVEGKDSHFLNRSGIGMDFAYKSNSGRSRELRNIAWSRVFKDASLGFLKDEWLTLQVNLNFQTDETPIDTNGSITAKFIHLTVLKPKADIVIQQRDRLSISNCFTLKERNVQGDMSMAVLVNQVCF